MAQEVLLTVIQAMRAGRVEKPEALGAFVLGVCRNLVWGENRAEARRRTQGDGDDLEALPDPRGTLPQALAAHDLQRCFMTLGRREMSVLILTFFEDWPSERIADAIGTTSGNVRVVRHRALGQLSTCLGDRS
jgi:RNA polymerase sigma-70 factor (ECF subfamily)